MFVFVDVILFIVDIFKRLCNVGANVRVSLV